MFIIENCKIFMRDKTRLFAYAMNFEMLHKPKSIKMHL